MLHLDDRRCGRAPRGICCLLLRSIGHHTEPPRYRSDTLPTTRHPPRPTLPSPAHWGGAGGGDPPVTCPSPAPAPPRCLATGWTASLETTRWLAPASR